ncbi:hypothetical protein EB241_14930 [Erwinia psidii]|uniref:Uncharacterized protein n=1 Tax=Erwinia psidii TaxID=69224 RepID=A0A3N6TQK4_9GAMM|nr:hypothetical protein EB241_14930 [Erwinia psidii]
MAASKEDKISPIGRTRLWKKCLSDCEQTKRRPPEGVINFSFSRSALLNLPHKKEATGSGLPLRLLAHCNHR